MKITVDNEAKILAATQTEACKRGVKLLHIADIPFGQLLKLTFSGIEKALGITQVEKPETPEQARRREQQYDQVMSRYRR